MKPWYFRNARNLVYGFTGLVLVLIPVSAAFDSLSLGDMLVAVRQLYGLWSLALLLTAMSIGPLLPSSHRYR